MLITLEKKDVEEIVRRWRILFNKIADQKTDGFKYGLDKIDNKIDELNGYIESLAEDYGIE